MNKLQSLVGKDLLPAVGAVSVKQGKSKTGSTYYYLSIIYKNGYESRIFLNSDSSFAISDASKYCQDPNQAFGGPLPESNI